MPTFPIYNLKFMKIKRDESNYFFLGEYDSDCERVFIPTLNKSFAKDEIVFYEGLTDRYVMSVKGPNKKVRYDEDEDGLPYCHFRRELNLSDIRKLETARNTPKTPTKKDGRFFR